MSGKDDEPRRLEELLAGSYEPLRAGPPGQREAMLRAISQPRGAPPARLSRRLWSRPVAWLATAGCLVVVGVGVALLVPSSVQIVYGVEAVPGRLAKVRTIRQRGFALVYDDYRPDAPPVRIEIEHLVKRPDKFRLTWYGVSQHQHEAPTIKHGVSSCDGQTESWIYREDKLGVTRPIGLLDAWIKTETHAQEFLATLLGPPGVAYRKVGSETIVGRQCDVYEGRFGRHDELLCKLWVDSRTGYPLRSTQDEILDDGSRRRVQQLEEIAVDVPLDDKLFEFAAPAGFRVQKVEPLGPDVAGLDDRYTTASYGGDEKIELWHAFRVTDNAALVVWRRSEPEANDDGTLNWLAGLSLSLAGGQGLVHDWAYQSHSPDVWNWSLVASADGPLPDRSAVRLRLKSPPLDARMEIVPLRFPDRGLARIIPAAAKATLPADGPRFTLADLRRLAGQLMEREQQR